MDDRLAVALLVALVTFLLGEWRRRRNVRAIQRQLFAVRQQLNTLRSQVWGSVELDQLQERSWNSGWSDGYMAAIKTVTEVGKRIGNKDFEALLQALSDALRDFHVEKFGPRR